MSVRAFAEWPVGWRLLSFSWPILCSGLLGAFDASVNAFWVGRELGDVAFAALSNANILWTLLFVGACGISTAGTVAIGVSLGRGDIQNAKIALWTMVGVSGAISLACVLVTAVCARSLIEDLGAPAASVPQAEEYLRLLLLSVPLTYEYGAIVGAVQAAGDSRIGFRFSVLSIAIDVAANPALINGFGPVPSLGIAGSAVATLGSQAIGLIALLKHLYMRGHVLCIRRKDLATLRIDWRFTRELLRQGGPIALQFLWVSIEEMLMLSLVNRFGVEVTAAYGAVIQLWNFLVMPAAALGMGITSIVAQNIGAERPDTVEAVTRVGLMFGILATTVLVLSTEALDCRTYGIFLPADSPALAFAHEINRAATWALIISAGYTVWVGVLRATGVVWAPLMISAAVLSVRYPVTLALLSHWQARAIWWGFPVSAAATAGLAILYGFRKRQARRPVPVR